MPAITGMEVARKVGSILNLWIAGEPISDNDGALILEAINDLLDSWSNLPSFIPVISRERFAMTSNQGGPDNPYTIGDGGDFDTIRPANQNSIVSANLILTTTAPEVRVPLGIYTDQAYDANQIPGMPNSQPTSLYYNPTYEDDLGSIFLWPVPDVDYNELELFIQQPVARFANLTTTYYVPTGWPLALKYNVADLVQGDFGRTMPASAMRTAVNSQRRIKAANTKLSELQSDAYVFGVNRQGLYNINSGNL